MFLVVHPIVSPRHTASLSVALLRLQRCGACTARVATYLRCSFLRLTRSAFASAAPCGPWRTQAKMAAARSRSSAAPCRGCARKLEPTRRSLPPRLRSWRRCAPPTLAQENVQAESAMMVPDCRMRLESALADLQAAVVRLVCSGGTSRGGCARARTHTGFDLRHRTPGGARRGGGRGRQRGADHRADTHRGGRPDVRLIRAQHTRWPARDAPVAAPACPRLACNCQRC